MGESGENASMVGQFDLRRAIYPMGRGLDTVIQKRMATHPGLGNACHRQGLGLIILPPDADAHTTGGVGP